MVVWCKYCKLPIANHSSLQCQHCDSFVHFNCLQYERFTRFEGDILFDFDCKHCGEDDGEKVVRSKLTWLQAIHLTLYNLSIRGGGRQGFFRWKDDICVFISQNWNQLFPDKPMTNNWRSTVAGTLSVYCNILFKSGQVLFNENGWWALTEVKPPPKNYGNEIKLKQKLKYKDAKQTYNTVEEQIGNFGRGKRKQKQDEDDNLKQFKIENDEKYLEMEYDLSGDDDLDNAGFSGVNEDIEDMVPNSDPFSLIKVEDIGRTLSENLVESIAVDDHVTPSDFMSEVSDVVKSENMSIDSMCEDSQSLSQDQFKTKLKFQRQESRTVKPRLLPMNLMQEREFLNKLNCYPKAVGEDPAAKRLQRKLKLRKLKSQMGLKLFDLDNTVREMIRRSAPTGANISFVDDFGRELPAAEIEEKISFSNRAGSLHHPALQGVNVLDRFHTNIGPKMKNSKDQAPRTFLSRLIGGNNDLNARSVGSPYTQRVLKPYIRRDYDVRPLKLRLMKELVARTHAFDQHWIGPCPSPIDYCYVQPHHIPAVNAMCEEFFWKGIDLSECLQYPDFSCVVLYRKLVIGCAFMVPDVKYNEAYISFVLVHPDWRKAGIGTFMIYHLIQTCMGKDVTLHVSASNSSMLLYQKFGFKAEELILDFYDKYLPEDSSECRHAFFLRLQR